MKAAKIFLILLLSFITGGNVFSQATAIITPGAFTAEDEITIRINVNGTSLAGETEVYLWAWCELKDASRKDALNNGSWTNSSEAHKMTNVGTNIWEIKIVPATFYGVNPGDLQWIGFLAKSKNGSKQTQDFANNNVTPAIFIPSVNRVFPSKLGQDDIATIYFDQSLATDQTQQRLEASDIEISIFDDGGVKIGSGITKPLKKVSEKQYTYTFIPSELFTIPTGVKLSKFEYKFKGNLRDADGNPVAAEGPTHIKTFDPVQ